MIPPYRKINLFNIQYILNNSFLCFHSNSAWISLSERHCKENNLIWHQEYSTDHPIIDVESLLTAVLIRHQSLGTLVLAVIDRGKLIMKVLQKRTKKNLFPLNKI